jgi:D-aspartate ligase
MSEELNSGLKLPEDVHRGRPLWSGDAGAVVIGGDYQGLGIVRSLGRRGVRVSVLDDELSIARHSRYVTHHLRVPDLRDEARTVDQLIDTCCRLNLHGWVLFPTREETVAAISKNRARLSKYFRVPTPSWEAVRWAWDKRNTYKLAATLGIPHPTTRYISSRDELRELDLSYPVALKPAIKEHFIYATKAKAWRADDQSQLLELYEKAAAHLGAGEVMIQDLIPGDGSNQFAYCAFFRDGSSVGKIHVRRARQHPPEFGRASTYVETVDMPELERLSERFLRAIDYYGLVELEYKRDTRDGQLKLLDVNARTWGYHSIGSTAGVDFPYMLYADQVGIPVDQQVGRCGVSWVRLATDLPTAAIEVLAGRMKLGVYLRTLLQADTEAVFCRDDLAPGLVELMLIPYLYVRRGF